MKSKNPTLTGLLITYNEERHIEEAITNLNFVDELIVVDSFSTDATLSILAQFPKVKVHQRKFVNFSDQRNFAIDQATKDWIIFLDADERLTTTLISEIKNVIKMPSNITGYKVKRQFMYKDKKLNYSGFQTDFSFRLFKNGSAKYNSNQKVHETLNVTGITSTLENEILHYSYRDYNSFKEKIDQYAYLNALELYECNKNPNWITREIKIAYKFFYNYIIRLGILDGKAGYTICSLLARGVRQRYKVLDQLFLNPPKE